MYIKFPTPYFTYVRSAESVSRRFQLPQEPFKDLALIVEQFQ